MKSKQSTKKGLLLFTSVMVLLCCAFSYLFLEGSSLPLKVCPPITYPQGDQIKYANGARVSFFTNDPMEQVVNFYDEELPKLAYSFGSYDLGNWKKQEFSDYTFYYCYGRDINFFTNETGCIYVFKQDEETVIEAIRYRSTSPCPPK